MVTITSRRLGALIVAGCAGLAACGGSGGDTGGADSSPTSGAETTTSAPVEIQTAAAPQRCDWTMNTVGFWEQDPPAEAGAHAHGHGQGNEHGAQHWKPLTDDDTCAELQDAIDTMEEVAARYPTAQDALDAGCFRATIYVPGIAAHYYCLKHNSAGTAIETPTMLLYGGSQPTAPVVGLSYMVYQEDAPDTQDDQPLWVKYMPWHYHEGLCIRGGVVIGGDNSDPARCEAAGGRVQGRTGWMGHYWLPNCPSPDGVFSAANPRLDIGVAAYNDDPANAAKTDQIVNRPCRGSEMKIDPDGADRFGAPKGADTAAASDGHTHSHDDEHEHED